MTSNIVNFSYYKIRVFRGTYEERPVNFARVHVKSLKLVYMNVSYFFFQILDDEATSEKGRSAWVKFSYTLMDIGFLRSKRTVKMPLKI